MTTIVEVIKPNLTEVVEVNSYVTVPSGGTTGQALTKTSNSSYAMAWQTITAVADWNTLTNKPSTFPPSAHSHVIADVTGLQTALNLKVDTSTLATVATTGSYSDLTGKPILGTASALNVSVGTTAASGEVVKGSDIRLSDARTPLSHTHVIGDITNLQTLLDGKFNNPTGDTTQYLAGDGSLIAFPVAGQAGTLVRQVRNETGSTLTKGTVVYISGASGNKPLVSKALATADATSAQTFGLLQADLTTNSNGYAVVKGDLIGFDTSVYPEGTQLYLSGSVAGAFTSTKPVAPIHMVYVGVVTRQHATQGQIEVSVQNGYELDEIHDVLIVSKANNEVLTYETSSGLWKNKSVVSALGFTPYDATNPSGYTSNTGTVTNFSFTNLNGFTGSVSTGTTTPTLSISLQNATAGQSGQLTSTDWNTFNNKQNALGFTPYNATNPAGYISAANLSLGTITTTTIPVNIDTGTDITLPAATTSLAGLLTSADKTKLDGIATGATANVGTVTNFVFTNGAGFTGTVSTATSTPTLSLTLQNAATGQSGQLTSTDWNTFNSKESALTFSTGLTRSVNTITVNTSQNIATLSNLTSNGLMKTSGGVGTLGIATAGTDYLAPFGSQTANFVYAAPSGSAGAPVFRAVTALDIPTLNQNTTGSAATLTTARNIQGVAFNGSANIDILSGTGFVKVTGTTVSYDNSTYLTTNQSITFTGDATGSGTTAVTLTIPSSTVTNAKLANVATATFKGRITASTGAVEDLSATQATSLLDTFTTSTKGLVGASGGGTTNFLRADGTWAAPAAGGGGVSFTEVELDFGSKPISSKKFTVTNGSISPTSKIVMSPSGNIATGRIGDDWEWDTVMCSCKSGTGSFTVTAKADGKIKGKRKFFYTYS